MEYCARLVSVTAIGADGRPVIVPWQRECMTPVWQRLSIPMNPGEAPATFDLCSKHYGEALLHGSQDAIGV